MQRDDGIPGAFRAHFARHNRQVLLLTGITLVAAVLFWGVAYIIIYWLLLLAATIGQGVDARLPESFLPAFAIYVVGLCILGWIVQKAWPRYFPRDKKPVLEILTDFVLAAPRVTLAVWGNLSAWQSLSEDEMQTAWDLFHAIGQQGKFNIHSLPLEIPEAALRTKIVFALQVTGLVEFRKNGDEMWLAVQGDEARHLSQSTIKIKSGRRK